MKAEVGPDPDESSYGYRYEDHLTRAVNEGFRVDRKPKTGRVLGVGRMLWDQAYPQTKELKKYRRKNRVDDKIDAKVDAKVAATIQKKLAEIFPQGMPSPTQHHLYSSTQQPRASQDVSCWLLAKVNGVPMKVAKGQIIPFTDGTRMMHGVVLPLDMTRVVVQYVMPGFEYYSLPHPPDEGITMLGQVLWAYLLKWPLNDIEEISPHGFSGNDCDPAFANLDPLFNIDSTGDNIAKDILQSARKDIRADCGPSADKPPVPIVFPEGHKWNQYKPGEPSLSNSTLMTLSTDLNVLHDDVVRRSKEEGQQGYRAKVLYA
jgi:hypothetical protein